MTRFLRLLHKWTGVITAPLMVMWFLSAFVMMIGTFPRVGREDRLKVLDDLSTQDSLPSPQTILTLYQGATTRDASVTEVTLEKRDGETLYILTGSEGERVFRASDGTLPEDRAPTVADIARLSERLTGVRSIEIDTLTDLDRWIPFSSREKDLPFYRAKVDDPARTEITVSGRDGQVLQITDRSSRLLAYFGAIPHWLYFTPLRRHADLWIRVFVVLGVVCCVMILSGLLLGVVRSVKALRRGKKRLTPYREPWLRWHHLSGLVFGIITLTWMFSGWMSLDSLPEWMTGPAPSKAYYDLSRPSPLSGEVILSKHLPSDFSSKESIKRLSYRLYFGKLIYRVETLSGSDYYGGKEGESYVVTPDDIRASIADASIGTGIESSEILTAYSEEYFPHPNGRNKLPLPVLHIETKEGVELFVGLREPQVQVSNRATRMNRWAYQRLHSLRFLWGWEHPVLWRSIMVILLMGGTVVSVTGFVLGCRTLKRLLKKRRPSRTKRSAKPVVA